MRITAIKPATGLRARSARPAAYARPARTNGVRVTAFKNEQTVKLQEREHMLETVHDWFDAISHPLIHVEPLLTNDAVLIDRIGGSSRVQRTVGIEQIEQRLAELHHATPNAQTLERADVVDVDHLTVCANWVCSTPALDDKEGAPIYGSYIFKFDAMGRICEVTHHQDADDQEFPDA